MTTRVFILPLLKNEFLMKKELVDRISAADFDVQLLPSESLPSEFFSSARNQYQSTSILRYAHKKLDKLGDRMAKLLVLTDVDIYEPGLLSMSGLAELNGKVALVSLARLQSENHKRIVSRAVKETIHELGHMQGLGHCPNRRCVMFYSQSLADSDIKEEKFCLVCQS